MYIASIASYSKLILASSPIPQGPTSLPCFCSSISTSIPRPLRWSSSSPSFRASLALLLLPLPSDLSIDDRSVGRLRRLGGRKTPPHDRDDVDCREAESSAALPPPESEVVGRFSAVVLSTTGRAGSDRFGVSFLSYFVECDLWSLPSSSCI